MTTTVEQRFRRNWSDFTVKDHTTYHTVLNIANVTSSQKAIDCALSFFSNYSGFDQTAYGEGSYTTGLTEQQSFDLWKDAYNKQEMLAKRQLISNGIGTITQSVYDAMVLYHWATGKLFEVFHGKIVYEILPVLKQGKYDTLADMIINSQINKTLCVRIATILRLADYGKVKTRTWYRSNGVFKMRDFNEKGTLNNDQLSRARFAYFAETGNFLPNTPEGLSRKIVTDYNSTLVTQIFAFDGATNFNLLANASMSPVEKLLVTINDDIQQHFFDFTLDGFTLTITKSMNTGDIVKTVIKI